jgi:hypothetical protein
MRPIDIWAKAVKDFSHDVAWLPVSLLSMWMDANVDIAELAEIMKHHPGNVIRPFFCKMMQ